MKKKDIDNFKVKLRKVKLSEVNDEIIENLKSVEILIHDFLMMLNPKKRVFIWSK